MAYAMVRTSQSEGQRDADRSMPRLIGVMPSVARISPPARRCRSRQGEPERAEEFREEFVFAEFGFRYCLVLVRLVPTEVCLVIAQSARFRRRQRPEPPRPSVTASAGPTMKSLVSMGCSWRAERGTERRTAQARIQ